MKRPQENTQPEEQPEAKRQKMDEEMEDLSLLSLLVTSMEMEECDGPSDHCVFCEDYAMPHTYMCRECAFSHGVD